MDGSKTKEGWCMLRCAGSAQSNHEIINRSMLRFRPIAPKPVSSGSVSGNLLVDNKNLLLKRSKRKYVRVRKNNGYKTQKNNIETDHHEDGLNKKVVTLQLLPEKPTTKEESLSWCNNNNDLDLMMVSKVDDNRQDLTAAIWLNSKGKNMINGVEGGGFGVSDQAELPRRKVVVVESWVTVESVTDTCMDTTRGLGCTDVERMKICLDNDTCPGFISDGFNRVSWTNEAYKKMVMGGSEENGDSIWVRSPEIEIMIWLVIKGKLPSLDYSMFTTKVRLQSPWQKEKYSKMVPCDVFRMDGGRFAWRLDIDAALSLGR